MTGSASLGEKFGGLEPRLKDLENMKEELADGMGGLDSMEDFEEDSETGRHEDSKVWGEELETATEDLDDLEDMEVGTEELEALSGDLETGAEDMGVLEVWVD